MVINCLLLIDVELLDLNVAVFAVFQLLLSDRVVQFFLYQKRKYYQTIYYKILRKLLFKITVYLIHAGSREYVPVVNISTAAGI